MWADWYGFKMEAYDAIKENIPFVHNAGACAIVHSDDPNGIQRLNQEAAKALADGRRAGINISEEVAWEWLSRNPGQSARHPRQDRHAGARQDGRRRAVERRSVQRLHAARAGVDRRRRDVRRQRSEAPPGQRFRARPAGRRRRRNDRAASLAALLLAAAAPAAAQTFAIVNGIVAKGDGSQPIQGGTVVVRDGRIVAAGRRSVPAGAQVIDAAGKWVTPGIVAGFSRLGLAKSTCRPSGSDDTGANGPFSAAIDVVPAVNPLATTIAVNRADGVTRALVAPNVGKSIFAGQGAVIDTGADMDPITAARKFQFVELGETGKDKAGGSRASAHVLFRNALREAAELRRYAAPIIERARRAADERERPVVRNPNKSRIYGPERGAARTCC